jgi:ankyrin repeat protein
MSDKLSAGEIFKRYKHLPEFDGLQFTDVNQRGNLGNSLLHVASTNGELKEVLSLLEAGADPNLRGEDGSTPLYEAVSPKAL